MSWSVERGLRLVAGTFVLASVALGVWVSPWWFAFTAFVGLNLAQSAFTNWCPMMSILRRAGLRAADERVTPAAGRFPSSAGK